MQKKYDEYGIEGKPVLFVKNDSGTYGLGIIEIDSGEQLLNLSNRKVNKLTYGKYFIYHTFLHHFYVFLTSERWKNLYFIHHLVYNLTLFFL